MHSETAIQTIQKELHDTMLQEIRLLRNMLTSIQEEQRAMLGKQNSDPEEIELQSPKGPVSVRISDISALEFDPLGKLRMQVGVGRVYLVSVEQAKLLPSTLRTEIEGLYSK